MKLHIAKQSKSDFALVCVKRESVQVRRFISQINCLKFHSRDAHV